MLFKRGLAAHTFSKDSMCDRASAEDVLSSGDTRSIVLMTCLSSRRSPGSSFRKVKTSRSGLDRASSPMVVRWSRDSAAGRRVVPGRAWIIAAQIRPMEYTSLFKPYLKHESRKICTQPAMNVSRVACLWKSSLSIPVEIVQIYQ